MGKNFPRFSKSREKIEIFDSAEKSTALPDNLRTFKTILIDFDLFDNFYLSRQN